MYYNYGVLNTSCLPVFGGDYGTGASAGAFCLYTFYSAALPYATFGVRLMFL